ncbi:MAG TPA: cyclopropane-fatty-acyl-phospholipid synthase family protein [Amycolatopsis sp.]|uniref:cyclopropane-fatty-acyl-phospholipid synthase family protein n=1 Tax=Amycolatopsis sp. TaxID=37632 RepID=UPI002B46CD78|nr:cyclopropane-fatty-acyl-phospholipid synthase family protein [Amycolatopsis sp.]HKS44023.1 cyclopropane-fatty-acyl-phospholipid synthase family protein [Amycolatopsis sp.]
MISAHGVAGTLADLVSTVLGDELPIRFRCWDGSVAGLPDAPIRLTFRHRRALRRLVWAPNELGLARAYVSGELDVEGDFVDTLTGLYRLISDGSLRAELGWAARRDVVRAVARVGAVGLPPKPPAEEIRLTGRIHSTRRDARAISHHYDVGNDFYALVLGPSMTYSCAYWDDTAGTLERAQIAKVDLVARKLGLTEGMRVLDVGCGWGTFVLHAAREYGVRAVGITLSQEQARFARKRAAEEGLADRVEIRVQDYRHVPDGPFDAIASIGMAEHVGEAMLPTYGRTLFDLLRPEGRLLNHAIAQNPLVPPRPDRTSFISRYVFPDGELEPLSVVIGALEESGFEVRDVESLREHYGRTLRAWVANLDERWAEAVRLSSPGRARVWRLYMAASALAFEGGRIGVNQVLAIKPGEHGASGMPATRAALLSGRWPGIPHMSR